MMERGIQIKGAEDPDPRAFDTDAVLVSQEEIEEQFAQVKNRWLTRPVGNPCHFSSSTMANCVALSHPPSLRS